VKAEYARQIRRGILRANGEIKNASIFLPLYNQLEFHAFHERMKRHHFRQLERAVAKLNTKGA
jgi:hypothetical protein